jgi:hypothetical protein
VRCRPACHLQTDRQTFACHTAWHGTCRQTDRRSHATLPGMAPADRQTDVRMPHRPSASATIVTETRILGVAAKKGLPVLLHMHARTNCYSIGFGDEHNDIVRLPQQLPHQVPSHQVECRRLLVDSRQAGNGMD